MTEEEQIQAMVEATIKFLDSEEGEQAMARAIAQVDAIDKAFEASERQHRKFLYNTLYKRVTI